MAKNIDWFSLKRDFILGSTGTLSDSLRKHDIKLNGYIFRKTKGWIEAREKYQKKILDEEMEKNIDEVVETESEVRARLISQAIQIQEKSFKAFEKYEPKNSEESLRRWTSATKVLTELFSLNKNNKKSSFENQQPPILNTRFTKELDNASYDEFIAILKRLKELEEERDKIQNSDNLENPPSVNFSFAKGNIK